MFGFGFLEMLIIAAILLVAVVLPIAAIVGVVILAIRLKSPAQDAPSSRTSHPYHSAHHDSATSK